MFQKNKGVLNWRYNFLKNLSDNIFKEFVKLKFAQFSFQSEPLGTTDPDRQLEMNTTEESKVTGNLLEDIPVPADGLVTEGLNKIALEGTLLILTICSK